MEKGQSIYFFENGQRITSMLCDPDYICDENIKKIVLENDKLYGIRLTCTEKYSIFWPDTIKIDFIEEIPEYIHEKLEQAKLLKNEIEVYKESRRLYTSQS